MADDDSFAGAGGFLIVLQLAQPISQLMNYITLLSGHTKSHCGAEHSQPWLVFVKSPRCQV